MCTAADRTVALALLRLKMLRPRPPHQHARALAPRRVVLTHVKLNESDAIQFQEPPYCTSLPQHRREWVLKVATTTASNVRPDPLDCSPEHKVVSPDQRLVSRAQVRKPQQKAVRAHSRRKGTLLRRSPRATPSAAREVHSQDVTTIQKPIDVQTNRRFTEVILRVALKVKNNREATLSRKALRQMPYVSVERGGEERAARFGWPRQQLLTGPPAQCGSRRRTRPRSDSRSLQRRQRRCRGGPATFLSELLAQLLHPNRHLI